MILLLNGLPLCAAPAAVKSVLFVLVSLDCDKITGIAHPFFQAPAQLLAKRLVIRRIDERLFLHRVGFQVIEFVHIAPGIDVFPLSFVDVGNNSSHRPVVPATVDVVFHEGRIMPRGIRILDNGVPGVPLHAVGCGAQNKASIMRWTIVDV